MLGACPLQLGVGMGGSREYVNEYLSRDPEACVGKKRAKGRGAVRVLSLAPGNVVGKGWGWRVGGGV